MYRKTRPHRKPFGGNEIIAAGDFLQIPPVPDRLHWDEGDYCFQSKMFDSFPSQGELNISPSPFPASWPLFLSSERNDFFLLYFSEKKTVDPPPHARCQMKSSQWWNANYRPSLFSEAVRSVRFTWLQAPYLHITKWIFQRLIYKPNTIYLGLFVYHTKTNNQISPMDLS